MAGSAGDVGSGALKGAAVGAPLGPYGMAGGAVVGGIYGYLSGGPSQAEKDAAAANAEHIANGKRNAIALANYRQNARDQYHQLLVNETTPYQAYSNRLAAAYGQGMSTAGLSANENPLTLRDTGVGAPEGSNYMGYTTSAPDTRPGMSGRTVQTVHEGIGAYLDHTDHRGQIGQGTGTNPYVKVGNTYATAAQNYGAPADAIHSAMADDTSLNPTYQPQSMALRPVGAPSSPTAGVQFRPRGA